MSDLFSDYPDKTILIYKNDELVFTSEYKGVRPMLEYSRQFGVSDEPLTVIDRIMGRGAVMLAVYINAKSLKTPIISEAALELALNHGLEVTYDKVVPYIVNREGKGQCPIEKSVLEIEDPTEGYHKIVETLAALAS